MTPELEALNRRAGACPRWKWMEGMLDIDGNRFQWRHINGQVEACTEDGEGAARWTEPYTDPDLSDPPTMGCIEHGILAEIYGPWVHLAPFPTHDSDGEGGLRSVLWWALADGKRSYIMHEGRYLAGPTKAEALIAALEVAT